MWDVRWNHCFDICCVGDFNYTAQNTDYSYSFECCYSISVDAMLFKEKTIHLTPQQVFCARIIFVSMFWLMFDHKFTVFIHSAFRFVRILKLTTRHDANRNLRSICQRWRNIFFFVPPPVESCTKVFEENRFAYSQFYFSSFIRKLSPTIESHRNENNFRHIKEQICVSTRPLWNTS